MVAAIFTPASPDARDLSELPQRLRHVGLLTITTLATLTAARQSVFVLLGQVIVHAHRIRRLRADGITPATPRSDDCTTVCAHLRRVEERRVL